MQHIKYHMQPEKTHRSTELYQAIANNDLGKLKSIIENSKKDLEKMDDYNDTPLLFAIEIGCLSMVRYLVEEANADIGQKGFRFPIHLAAQYNRLDIVRYLFEQYQVDCDVQNLGTNTPIFLAAENGYLDIVRYLVEVAKVDPEKSDYRGWAPIHAAATHGHLNVVRYLVEVAKVDFNKSNNYGPPDLLRPPRYLAINNDVQEVADYLKTIGSV